MCDQTFVYVVSSSSTVIYGFIFQDCSFFKCSAVFCSLSVPQPLHSIAHPSIFHSPVATNKIHKGRLPIPVGTMAAENTAV
ncbi:hypothetical protein GDO81_026611 [Engystomops pustulosus]|uniref:Uncharacterized protein n=1 Tax=Engystomops pustulosus TaxID=76066 RepID=A0AAV6Z2U3_ENGPU|nr:hypothetical protein GDO81_026611 [Engystomops pustulosus]